MSTDLSNTIEDAAKDPRRATVDGNTAEQHNLRDVIEADKYLARVSSAARNGLPIRMAKLRPPGAI